MYSVRERYPSLNSMAGERLVERVTVSRSGSQPCLIVPSWLSTLVTLEKCITFCLCIMIT